MDEKMMPKNDDIEIDVSRLIGVLVHKAWLIVIAAVLCAVITFVGTILLATPQYQSAVMFYVNNNAASLAEESLSISSADITASRGLVKSYIVILNARETLNEVIDYADIDHTYDEVKDMIFAESVDNTEIFRVVVTNSDPWEAEKIANAIAHILPKRISGIIEGTSAKIVDSAIAASQPSSPNRTQNTMIGLVVGFALSAGFVILKALMDTRIHTEEDIAQSCKYPVLASVPDMEYLPKTGSIYGYGKKKVSGKSAQKKSVELTGLNISFAAAESYKLLRTKLQFSLADEDRCHVIGISSAIAGEGKSLSAVNLAYFTAQLGKRVLLIDCDMRHPSLADKLPVKKYPGLSDYLAGKTIQENLLQHCGFQHEEKAFHVISSGHTPPDPMELLSSARMEQMIAQLRQNYDYIILDLPPAGEVGDAMAAAKLTDGMLIVVRQNYGNRMTLHSAVRQLEFVDAKILGVIFNGITKDNGMYSGYCKQYSHR